MAGQLISDFPSAAQRHFKDAQHLRAAMRLASADHFAGFAAECGLKAILLAYLGGTMNANQMPTHSTLPGVGKVGHVNHAWNQLAIVAQGRAAAQFTALIGGPNPFHNWDVSDRYSSGAHINEPHVDDHLEAARRVLEIYDRAQVNGALS